MGFFRSIVLNLIKQSKKGFTLIELIVVFSVIAILSTAGLAAFVDYSRQQTINTVTQEIKTMIFDARSKASSQVSRCANGQQFNGYLILFCPTNGSCTSCGGSNTGYQMDIRCDSTDSVVKGEHKEFPPNISVSPDSHTLLFGPISGIVSSPCDNQSYTSWNIAVNGYGKAPQTISVFNTGIIR